MSSFSRSFGHALVGLGLVQFFLGAAEAWGGEPRRLTHDGTLKLAPVVLNSSGDVVFARHETPNLVALFRLTPANGQAERLQPAVAAHQFDLPCHVVGESPTCPGDSTGSNG